MPTKLHYTSAFVSNNQMNYNVQIWHKTIEVTSTTEISLGGKGFNISWQKAKDPILGGIMPSTCVVNFLVKNATELTAAHTILTAQNQSYYIVIQRTADATPNWNTAGIWWAGWVTSGFDGYPDKAFPYVVDIKSTCSLNKPLNKYNNQVDVASQSDYKDLTEPLQIFEDNYDLDLIWGSSYFQWAFQSNWWNGQSGGTPPADTNPLRITYYNRAAFVTNPDDFPLTIENYIDELKGVLKSFMLRLMQSGGRYWAQQSLFLDVPQPDPSISNHADASSGEIFPGSTGYPDNTADEITIDNTATPTTANKGIILSGAKYSVKNEAKSVRAKYIFGNDFCTIPASLDYTAGLVSLGYLSQGTTNLKLFLNVTLKQTFPLTGAGAVTPCFGQGEYMTGILVLKIKVGNKYLAHVAGSDAVYNFYWTTTESTIAIHTGAGTYYETGFSGIQADQADVINALAGFGGGYPYPFTQFQSNVPSTGTATATARFYLAGVPLPELGSTYGAVQMQIMNNDSYVLYWTPDTPYTNIFGDWGTWITNHNPATSTNLSYNTSTGTPATPTTQTINMGVVPYSSDLTVDEELAAGDDQPPIGAIYYASQANNDQAPDINLGELSLGTNSSSNQITTLRAKIGADYVATNGFRSGATGGFISPGQLLVNEYFKTLDEPMIILSGTIVSTSYEAHRTIKYDDKIGGGKSRFIFAGGSFNPQADSWSGSWCKLNISAGSIVEDEDTIYTGPIEEQETGEVGQNKAIPSPGNLETTNTKQGYILNDLIVGVTTEDVTAGVTINKVDLKTLICKVYDDQKLYLANRQLRAVTELIVSGTQSAAATQINFDNVAPAYNYASGSFVMLRVNDLSNVITAGTATPNLYKGITQTVIYIKSDEFKATSDTSINVYTRDGLGSVQPTSYASRTKIYASTYIPTGYKVTAVDVYSSQNRTIAISTSRTISDTVTSQGSGTANTTLTLGTPWTSILGDYFIISYEIGASTDEIYGAKLTIIAV